MFRRRAFLDAVAGAGVGVALAGCISVDGPEGGSEGEGEDLGVEADDPADTEDDESGSMTVDTDELLQWLPADATRPLFRSYELMAADDAVSDDDRPTVGGEPVLATLEFAGVDTDDGDSPPVVAFLADEPESDGAREMHETDDYVAVIGTGLDEEVLVETYEGAVDRLTDVDGDVETAYAGVDLDYRTRCVVEPDAEYATVFVSSTDGEAGQLAVVFEDEPTDPELDAVREDRPGVGSIVGTGERLVVFEYTVEDSDSSDSSESSDS